MKLIILDRDGVINEDSDDYIKSPEEFIPLPGSLDAMARLSRAGYTIAIATNQSGIARGYFDIDTLHLMHEKLMQLLAAQGGSVGGIFFCPHGPDDSCECRKPKPGLLLDIKARFNTVMQDVPVVGDSLRDLQSAKAVGAKPVLVRTGKGMRTLARGEGLDGVPVYDDLASFVDHLLTQEP
ncbi:MAG: D-glycero-beta-D-manno-heptose 1,7-bisphosphate 7-phosphatase [Gammaproteobacteria bacterium]|nr:D-glycero-beta-D-manno-heptose 1,7-bisphosphate 7-phosphatase [Gammaproteobacteria bacterium]